MTHEEKLAAIIKAQAKGGHVKWLDRIGGGSELVSSPVDNSSVQIGLYEISDDELHDKCWYEDSIGILQILLDTEGCKAAYGDEYPENWSTILDVAPPFWQPASSHILKAWHRGEGNNWQEAINVAYELLPKA